MRIVIIIIICFTNATISVAQVTKEAINNNNTKLFAYNMNNNYFIGENNNKYSEDCSDNPIYKKIIALKEEYPDGMEWTNDNSYNWKGGIYTWGNGCAAFAFMLSDAAFGNLPARKHYDFNNLRIGDILRMDNNTHFVIILCINSTTVTFAEGNYDASIYWGRTISIVDIKSEINFVLTRYPE